MDEGIIELDEDIIEVDEGGIALDGGIIKLRRICKKLAKNPEFARFNPEGYLEFENHFGQMVNQCIFLKIDVERYFKAHMNRSLDTEFFAQSIELIQNVFYRHLCEDATPVVAFREVFANSYGRPIPTFALTVAARISTPAVILENVHKLCSSSPRNVLGLLNAIIAMPNYFDRTLRDKIVEILASYTNIGFHYANQSFGRLSYEETAATVRKLFLTFTYELHGSA